MTSESKGGAKDMRLVIVETPEQRRIFTTLTKTFHSYVPQPVCVGCQVNYLIMWGTEAVGNVGLAQAPNFASHTIMNYFGLPNQKAFIPLLPHVGNLWRMTLKDNLPENTASRILGVFVRVAPVDWKAKYGTEIGWIMTFTGEEKKGTIYKAAGWGNIGKSAGVIIKGRGYSSFHGNKAGRRGDYTETKGPKKDIWMKVLPHSTELDELVRRQGRGKVVAKTTPQADVVQSSTPGFQSGDGVHNDPSAPLPTKEKYRLRLVNGKYRIR